MSVPYLDAVAVSHRGDGDLRRLSLAALISVLLHLLLAWLILAMGVTEPPAVEEELRVPLSLEAPEPPPPSRQQARQHTATPVPVPQPEPPPEAEKQEKQPPAEGTKLFGWNLEGE